MIPNDTQAALDSISKAIDERNALRERVRELATALERLIECMESMSGCSDFGGPWNIDEDVDVIAARAALEKAGRP